MKACSLDIFCHKTVCQNKSLSPMSLFLAINQYFVILYLSKQIYMCTMNKFAKTKQNMETYQFVKFDILKS